MLRARHQRTNSATRRLNERNDLYFQSEERLTSSSSDLNQRHVIVGDRLRFSPHVSPSTFQTMR